jgi:hypothetical protein
LLSKIIKFYPKNKYNHNKLIFIFTSRQIIQFGGQKLKVRSVAEQKKGIRATKQAFSSTSWKYLEAAKHIHKDDNPLGDVLVTMN